jgi:hypothetical protein
VGEARGHVFGARRLERGLLLFWGEWLHGHVRHTKVALPSRVHPREPHKL